MPHRWTKIRTVDPGNGINITVHTPLDLWWPALAAANETMQGGPLAPAWLRLFSAHLSSRNLRRLCWGGDLAESAEMRRAYSSLYGRYFARGILTKCFGFRDFISLRSKITTLPNGIKVTRIQNGDIPDWIAWDPIAGQFVLCEAKGNLTGSEHAFLTSQPSCVTEGKKQFQRVAVTDAVGNLIATKNWVAANLWSTDSRSRESVSLLWDPPSDGERISDKDRYMHSDGIRRLHIASLAARFGRPNLLSSTRRPSGKLVNIIASPQPEDTQPASLSENGTPSDRFREVRATTDHSGTYIVAIIQPLGIRPIVTEDDMIFLRQAKANASNGSIPAMIFGVNIDDLHAKENPEVSWVSENGIVSDGGISLFNLAKISIDSV